MSKDRNSQEDYRMPTAHDETIETRSSDSTGAAPADEATDAKPMNPLKYDSHQAPVQLLPTLPLMEIAKVFGYGAEKYRANSWREPQFQAVNWSRTYGSIMRHLMAWNDGENLDESGHHHLAHAGTQLMILIEHVFRNLGTDDRRTPFDGERDFKDRSIMFEQEPTRDLELDVALQETLQILQKAIEFEESHFPGHQQSAKIEDAWLEKARKILEEYHGLMNVTT